ncbi:MAG: CoA pyrophosphatase [Dehalococcoidales bacterium]|nr:CoA pyrophosphatase [Dehalococcoidales bacterium]
MEGLREKLKQTLATRPRFHMAASGRRAAVLVPVYCKDGQYYILFTKRTDKVTNHKSEISFPGGAYQEGDPTLLDTALRECTEEIGLEAVAVEVLGELDVTATLTTNYIITPYVGLIGWPQPLKLDGREAEEIIEIPVLALLQPGCLREEIRVVGGRPITASSYNYQGRVIWGATARILRQFLGAFVRSASSGEVAADCQA